MNIQTNSGIFLKNDDLFKFKMELDRIEKENIWLEQMNFIITVMSVKSLDEHVDNKLLVSNFSHLFLKGPFM